MFRLISFIALISCYAAAQVPKLDQPLQPVDSLRYLRPDLKIKEPPALHPAVAEVFSHGARDKKCVALTFDACATRVPSHFDERIAQILAETKTPATIFLGGKWMTDQPGPTRALAANPQLELANHSFLHPHLKEMSDERVRQEIQWTQTVLYTLTGKQATLFRAPYGELDDRVVRIASGLGLTTVQYDLPSGDPDTSATKEKLIDYVSSMARNGSIIVMHINRRGWHTAEALPEIIARLRKRGFTFVTVGELIERSMAGAKK